MSGLVVGALAALLLATALSGCAESGGAGQGTPEEQVGTLRGIVVDVAIRPLPNVQLSVRGPAGTLWANSTAGGVFEFAAALPFGAYVVAAQRAGFLDTYAAAEVDGGDRPVRIQMEADAAARAYATAHLFRGFIECGTSTVGIAIAACQAPNAPGNLVGDATCSPPTPCVRPGNVTHDNISTALPLEATPQWAQHEVVWQPTQSLGDQLRVAVRGIPEDPEEPTFHFESVAGPSPLLAAQNTTALQESGIGPGWALTILVFAGGMQGAGSQVCTPAVPGALEASCLFDSGATLEQEFTVYSHLFYGFTPPPGYRFSVDGEPVPPQP